MPGGVAHPGDQKSPPSSNAGAPGVYCGHPPYLVTTPGANVDSAGFAHTHLPQEV